MGFPFACVASRGLIRMNREHAGTPLCGCLLAQVGPILTKQDDGSWMIPSTSGFALNVTSETRPAGCMMILFVSCVLSGIMELFISANAENQTMGTRTTACSRMLVPRAADAGRWEYKRNYDFDKVTILTAKGIISDFRKRKVDGVKRWKRNSWVAGLLRFGFDMNESKGVRV